MDEVPLSLMHKCSFDVVPTLTGDHWRDVLPNAVVWMDYFSVPSRLADVSKVKVFENSSQYSTSISNICCHYWCDAGLKVCISSNLQRTVRRAAYKGPEASNLILIKV